MAVKPQIKANQLAKDLGLKSKDIVDIMAEKGIELKTQKSLEPHEFDVLFDAVTSAHQIEGIDDYIDGITFIPSKLEKKEEKAPAAHDIGTRAAAHAPEAVEPAHVTAFVVQGNEVVKRCIYTSCAETIGNSPQA